MCIATPGLNNILSILELLHQLGQGQIQLIHIIAELELWELGVSKGLIKPKKLIEPKSLVRFIWKFSFIGSVLNFKFKYLI